MTLNGWLAAGFSTLDPRFWWLWMLEAGLSMPDAYPQLRIRADKFGLKSKFNSLAVRVNYPYIDHKQCRKSVTRIKAPASSEHPGSRIEY